ncbi:T9SS type B sorting domain-containing protein [Tenacibaculum sp. IB213877]|uniref:T9SS type B sorting domain-containing protein n=1 Tax=Tenacibaculum sp. IB213877 TaxID=3097351 RepID=UPI002A5AC88D|nr:T9SS type B sorting domain-containing protein [Tenacibaculum sp. IB213877]MDY0779916.1 T9SS type B sorting domain-containing protein [Tenacibaculum sp. IB213877]
MKKLTLLTLLFSTFLAFSQKQANVWYFGRNAGIDFNSGTPTSLSNSQLNTLEGCSSFSDENGNLLFYSDGITVWDRNHTVMRYSNGNLANDLKGHPSSTQSGMIIPRPGSANIYYLFTVDDGPGSDGISNGLNLYTIDISLNGGLGELIDEDGDGVFFKNLSNGRESDWTEKVAAVRGSECNTYWVVSAVQNQFYAFKIDASGVSLNPIISTVNEFITRRGYLKLSPDGTRLAVANQSSTSLLYDFSSTTGEVGNRVINLTSFGDGEPYGVEFSVDSKKLYISTVEGFRQTMFDPPTTYRLFQFDLNQTNITASKFLIHQQIPGFRGALQLGPDSKIYATIPLAYDDPSGDSEFLDVIENPNANAADVIFTKKAVDLQGKLSTQGLPPFISSLLLPIQIVDLATNEVINNQDLQYCIGESINISPETVTGSNINYEWTFDNGSTITAISNTSNLTLNNLDTSNNGAYLLTVTLTDDCGNQTKLEGTFNIGVYQPATAGLPSDISFCDTDGDGFNIFDLQADVTPQVLGTQDSAQFEVLYFLTQADADNNVTANALPNPYTNPSAFSSQTIFARIHNIDAPDACYDTTQFNLVVTGYPQPSQPTDYAECDDTANGGDTDGFFNNFILSTKDIEVLGSLSPTQYSVSYHTTLTGAQTDALTDVIDKNNPYRNTTANQQTIFVRVENVDNPNCSAVSENGTTFEPFNLIVNPLPVITNDPAQLTQCDTDADLNTNVNLTQAEINISADYTNETFIYYPTQADAIADTNAITNTYSYNVSDGDSVWIRTITSQGCYRISQLDITVSYAGDVAYDRLFQVCDDFLDTDGNDTANNNDTDGISYFDISDAENEVKALFPVTIQQDLDILFFETIADRDAVINQITDLANYRNTNVPATTQQPIYIKIINTVNNDCTGIGQLYILAQPVPEANPVNNITLCDDFDSGSYTDGENVGIDLTTQNSGILGTQNPADYTITFYTSSTDANVGNNPITNDTNFRNTAPAGFTVGDVSTQTIYVRIENNTTACFNDHLSFDIVINPLPTINNTIQPLEVCDTGAVDNDTRNGLEQQIDLSVKDAEILDGRDPAQFEVSYHTSQQDAIDGVNPVNKISYDNNPLTTTVTDNIGEETLWISILNNVTGCRYGINSLLIRVQPEPNILLTDISNISECDNDDDSDDTNGIIQTIDLTTKETEILTNYPVAQHDDFTITYHLTQDGAINNTDVIPDTETSAYTNISNPQRIYIRVVYNDTGCVNDDTFFDIIINPLPDFQVTSPQIVCLNNPPVVLQVENPNGTYDYIWTKDTDPTVLGTTEQLNVDVGGHYHITATNTTTGCTRTRTIIVEESIIASIEEEDITIIDDSNNNSISINNEDNNLGVGDYEFALQNEQGFIVQNFQDEPYFEGLEGGIYTILVRDKNGCGLAQIEVSVIEFPKFFTPNNDGYNDTWTIKGANTDFYPQSTVYIFDRHGKTLASFPIDSEGWNGLYNGKPLPSNDYWFNIQLIDNNGNIKNKKGHFSLLRK